MEQDKMEITSDYYVIVVDESVGDSGVIIHDFGENNSRENVNIVDDIRKHLYVDIKSEISLENDTILEECEVQEPSQHGGDDYVKLQVITSKSESVENAEYDSKFDQGQIVKSRHVDSMKKACVEDDPRNEILEKSELRQLGLDEADDNVKLEPMSPNIAPDDNAVQVPIINSEKRKLINHYVKAMQAHEEKGLPPLLHVPYKIVGDSYKCKYCTFRVTQEKKAIKHYRFHHGERYHRCLACNRAYTRPYTLIFHETNCNAENANLVRIAREIFEVSKKSKVTYRQKMRYTAPCNICGKHISSGNMKYHQDSHFNIKRFKCSICPAAYRTNRAKIAHMNTHTGERPYKCEECTNDFSSYNALLEHKKRHRNIYYRCHKCDCKFVQNHRLKMHLQKHHNENHNKEDECLCTICGEVLPNQKSLTKHLKTHVDHKYKCHECSKMYFSLKRLKHHMKEKHDSVILSPEEFLKQIPSLTVTKIKKEKDGK